jgi:hypothetical protein
MCQMVEDIAVEEGKGEEMKQKIKLLANRAD